MKLCKVKEDFRNRFSNSYLQHFSKLNEKQVVANGNCELRRLFQYHRKTYCYGCNIPDIYKQRRAC